MSDEMTLSEACAVTDQFGKFLKGMGRLQDAANALRSADQAVADRRRQEAEILARVASAQTQLDALNAQAAELTEAGIAASQEARATAAQILADAREEADKLLNAAKAEAAQAREDAAGIIARKEAAVRELKSATAELAQVTARLDQAKAEGRKIFGGA